MDHFGLANAKIQKKVILTEMVIWAILDHFGPVHFPTVLRPFPIVDSRFFFAFWKIQHLEVLIFTKSRRKNTGAQVFAEKRRRSWNFAATRLSRLAGFKFLPATSTLLGTRSLGL